MNRPQRSAGRPGRTRAAIAAASGLLLAAAAVGTIATTQNDTTAPAAPPTPGAIVYAEAGPGCGAVTVGIQGNHLEWYRADLPTATTTPAWVRQPPMDRTGLATYQPVDAPYVQCRVIWAAGEHQTAVIGVEPCPTGGAGTPTPNPRGGTATPTVAAAGSPGRPAEHAGGLAETGGGVA